MIGSSGVTKTGIGHSGEFLKCRSVIFGQIPGKQITSGWLSLCDCLHWHLLPETSPFVGAVSSHCSPIVKRWPLWTQKSKKLIKVI